MPIRLRGRKPREGAELLELLELLVIMTTNALVSLAFPDTHRCFVRERLLRLTQVKITRVT